MSVEARRLARKLYKLRHRDKVNEARRRRRMEKRAYELSHRKCARCSGSLQYQKHSMKYCETCRTKYTKYLRYFWPKTKKYELQHSNIPLNDLQKAILKRKEELWAIADYDF